MDCCVRLVVTCFPVLVPYCVGMSGPEHGFLLEPNALPPALAEFLRGQRLACVTEATDQGTALVIKAPALDIESMRGRIPILLRHELYAHPAAPVIRMVLRMYDRPRNPLALETFINIEDPAQRADYAALGQQENIPLLFYDQDLEHRLSKRVRNDAQEIVARVLAEADTLLVAVPKHRFSFETAKAAVMRMALL